DDLSTANVGTIHGGTAANIVPEWCTFVAEARSHDERRLAELIQEMQDAITFAAGVADCDVETKTRKSYRGYRFNRGDRAVTLAALTPAGALELIKQGHEVAIETGAGLGSAMPDADYERVGARITSVDDVWESSDLVLKVKEPIEPEYPRLREGLILFTYLHIA